MKHLLPFVIVTFMISPLLVWYDHLWLPHTHLAYWKQILPISGTFLLLAVMFKKSWMRYLLSVPAGLLFAASIIVQVLVWIDILHLPFF